MGSRKTQTLRGLLIPDTRLSFANVDAALSSYTQDGERPGSADGADPRSRILPLVSGEQGIDLDVRVGRAGYPGTDARKTGGLLVREDGASDWIGWNPWNVIERAGKMRNSSNRQEVVDQAPYRYGAFAGQKVMAVCGEYDGTSPPHSLVYDVENPSFYWTDNGDMVASGTDYFWDSTITQLPDGRFIWLVAAENATTALAEWRMYYSDDDGVTWDLYDGDPFGANGALPDVLDTNTSAANLRNTKSQIRALPDGSVVFVRFQETTYNGGGIGINNQYTQWASKGLGSGFVEVDSWTAASAGGTDEYDFAVDVLKDGRILFVTGASGTTGTLDAVVIGGAFDPINDTTATNITTRDTSRLGACVAFNGALVILGTSGGDNYRYESFDYGASWNEMELQSAGSYGGGFPWFGAVSGGTGFNLNMASIAPVGAGLSFVYACDDGSAVVTEDDQPNYLILGGWTNLEYKSGHNTASLAERYTATYVPMGLPDSCSDWTAAGTGTPSVGADGLLTVTTSSSSRYYTAPTNANASDAELVAQFAVVSGGALTSPQIGMRAISNDGGSNVFGVYIGATTAGYRILDYWPGTTIDTITRDMTVQTQVYIWVSGVDGSYVVADRTAGDVLWTIRATGTATGSGFVGNTQMDWGNIQSGTGVSDWAFATATYTRQAASVGALEPRTSASSRPLMLGAPMSTAPVVLPGASTTAGASSISVEGGPGRFAETWDIPRDYDYPARSMFTEVEPSPSKPWSATDNGQNDFVWDLTDDSPLADGSGSIGVYLDGCELDSGTLSGWNGSAWVTLLSIDMSGGFSGSYTLTGDTMVSSAASSTRYMLRGELDGGFVSVNAGATFHTVAKQTEGRWDSGITTKQATIRLEDPTGAAASSTFVGYYPRGLFVAHNVASYDRYRLRISSNSTPSGKTKIGTVLIGAFIPAGRQWSLGSTTSLSGNVSESVNRYGTKRRTQNGPPARTVSVNWSDPADLYVIRQSDADPDYLAADAGDPLAAYQDVPYWLHGVFGDLDSGTVPCVLCTSVPDTDASIVDRSTFLYGYMTRAGDLTMRLGAEGESEVIGVGSTVFEEIK